MTLTTELVVKNLRKFQHYRDRNPPWIKLHTRLLSDPEFVALEDATRFHLIALWIVASRSDGVLPDNAVVLSRLIGSTDPVNLDGLVSSGFLIRRKRGDSTALADGEQPVSEVLSTENREQNYYNVGFGARDSFCDADRDAVDAFLDGRPDHEAYAWGRRISGYLDGLDFPQGRRATPEAIGTACRDLVGKPDVSPAMFRRFVERAMADASDPIAERRLRRLAGDDPDTAAARWAESS